MAVAAREGWQVSLSHLAQVLRPSALGQGEEAFFSLVNVRLQEVGAWRGFVCFEQKILAAFLSMLSLSVGVISCNMPQGAGFKSVVFLLFEN